MTYEEKIIEDCLKELKSLMRYLNCSHIKEFRICESKIGRFRLTLFKLYQEGFKQGVYTTTSLRK